VLGLVGMLLALVVGPHLAGSVAIYIGLAQAALFWFALWKYRRSLSRSSQRP